MAITQTDWNKSIREHPLFAVASAIEGYRFRGLLKSKDGFDAEVKRIINHIEKNKAKLTSEQTATYEKIAADMAQEKNRTQNKKATSEQKTQNDASKAVETPEKVSESEVQETSDTNEGKQPKTPKNPLEKDPYYKIAKLAGMDISLYDSQDPEVRSKISKDLHNKISQNKDEDNQKIRDAIKGKKYLLQKFENILKQIQEKKEKKQNRQQGKKNNSTPTPKKEGENNMTEGTTKDYQKELENSPLYRLAKQLGIDTDAYKAANKEDFDKVSGDIKNAVKAHQQKQTEEQRKNELDGLKKDKPELASEYEKIEKEDKPAPKTERETATVEDKKGTDEEENSDSNWIAEKMKFWKDYAEEKSLTPDFNIPEGDTSKVYCKLSNGEKEEGLISYTSKKDIQISKESSLTIYQGLVKDAVKSNLSITFGKSLNETQQLMLYAAVLLSEDKYEGTDEKAQVLNPPPLDKLIKSDAFKNLPDEAKKVLMVQRNKERLAQVRGMIKKDNEEKNLSTDNRYELRKAQVSLMKTQLSPEELAARNEKELARDKIMAARLGIIPEQRLNFNGKDRVVTKDENLFNDDGTIKDASTKEVYDALLKRKKELEGK